MYLYENKDGKIIYVGKAKDLKKRVSSYFKPGRILDTKTSRLIENIKNVNYIQVGSEIEAFLLEANLIKKYKPFYNIQYTDDKYFPYIKIGKIKQITVDEKPVEIPYITLTRKQDEKNARFFGPYPSSANVKTVLKVLRRIFPFQSIKNHSKRTCLYYHLKLCPCIPTHPENITEYKRSIRKISSFLNGHKERTIKQLLQEQKQFVNREEYEKAGIIQSQIDKINYITSETYSPFKYEEKPDYYFERVQEELASLQAILSQYNVSVQDLSRIECYDISNFTGKQATGSMVTFENGEAAPAQYRRFKIKTLDTPDDFSMHQEIMERRLKHEEWKMPGLFVIDGGKGQVSSILKVFEAFGITTPVIGLAKREETIILPYTDQGKLIFKEVKLPLSTPAVNLLRRIRNEAHRFAISYHKLLRTKNMLPQ